VVNLSYFYSTVLDIIVLLDRIATFNKTVDSKLRLVKTRSYRVCFAMLMVCAVVDLPYFLVFEPNEATVRLNETISFTVNFSNTTSFSRSQLGVIITFLVFALRDGVVMVFQITLNVVSMIMLKKLMRKRMRLLSVPTRSSKNFNVETPTPNPRKTSKLGGRESLMSTTNSENSATVMVFIICALSVLVHLLQMVMIIYPYFNFNLTVFVLYLVGDGVLPLKACATFFIFFFNKRFKRHFFRAFEILY
jgi:hypothetical protein